MLVDATLRGGACIKRLRPDVSQTCKAGGRSLREVLLPAC